MKDLDKPFHVNHVEWQKRPQRNRRASESRFMKEERKHVKTNKPGLEMDHWVQLLSDSGALRRQLRPGVLRIFADVNTRSWISKATSEDNSCAVRYIQ
ncbi:hypothetical protein Q5P01_006653 [Channa striata]|uniref:Uncharacterized protein n=1 Tax=Channa striata TaxID=64152 RepID=A0AA88N972_CHASR|nr:hypothetical protein Q5P01_006653 [Channa striata]